MKYPGFHILTFLGIFLFATTGLVFADETPQPDAPESGEIVLPDDYQDKEKKCLTVCKEWGEDCMLNPSTGARKCRRVCKQFGEECFTDL